AMVIPLLSDGRVVMERQFRYPHRREFFEFPAGKIDPGEESLTTAKRELREETGYEAEEWRHLTTIHPIVSYTDERIEIFVARKLTLKEAERDAGEF
ncbi:NUDIX domain-containing protein, partial [Lacticaseibacillus paracasei]|uniref:NUDIX domain-containing protein n=1 Tax=Lacticaseibacillus paracasei TaxID=1597 RepID=UPI00194F2F44